MAKLTFVGKYEQHMQPIILSHYFARFAFGFSEDEIQEIINAGRCFKVEEFEHDIFYIDSYAIAKARKYYKSKNKTN